MKIRNIVNFIVIPAIALGIVVNLYMETKENMSGGTQVESSGQALIGGNFTLTDQNGKTVSDTDFKGKLMLVYFGFTSCPDVCPVDLAVITKAMEELGADAEKIQPVFITVDPQRDTPEQMKTYLANFHPSILGLSGSKEDLDKAAAAYRIYSRKVEAAEAHSHEGGGEGEPGHHAGTGGYTMDHSAYIYLMDKDGKYITHFNHGQEAGDIVKKVRENL